MTNKESIQAAHLEAIKKQSDLITDKSEVVDDFKYNDLATSCTTITAEAIGEAMEWASDNNWEHMTNDDWYNSKGKGDAKTKELVQLFLNQKAKI